jgi:hypothetical protein
VELSAGADSDSNSSPSTSLNSARSCHLLLLLLPPLLTHRDSLPPAPGTLVALIARSATATTVAPLPPSSHRCRRSCELLPHAYASAVVGIVLFLFGRSSRKRRFVPASVPCTAWRGFERVSHPCPGRGRLSEARGRDCVATALSLCSAGLAGGARVLAEGAFRSNTYARVRRKMPAFLLESCCVMSVGGVACASKVRSRYVVIQS